MPIISLKEFLKKGARTILPKELEYRTGLTTRPMEFKIGERLTPEQKIKAEEVVRKPAIIPLKGYLTKAIEKGFASPQKPLFKLPGIAGKIQEKVSEFILPESIGKRVQKKIALGAPQDLAFEEARKEYTKEVLFGLAIGATGELKIVGGKLAKPMELTIKKYLSNAYKVYSGQKPFQIVAKLADDIIKKTNLPKEVVVTKTFYDHLSKAHSEIPKEKIFQFVKTLNIPDEIYKLPLQEKLNFFRTLEDSFVNVVGTFKKGEGITAQQVVTSFLTNKPKYPASIKKTAEAVYLKTIGGAAKSSSLKGIPSPPAGQLPEGISGVSSFVKSLAKPEKLVKRITETQLKVKVSKEIANEAIKFAKENPKSSLVAKEFRNKWTKELESGPRLFKRIGEAIRDNEININELPKLVKQYGISAEETAKLFEDAATYSGRTLQSLSRVEKELRALLPDIEFPKRIPTGWEKFKSGYLAVDNFRRGLLVSQLATAARNAISQTKRYSTGIATDAMDGVISKITGKGAGFTPFFEDIAAILRKTSSKNKLKLEQLLKKHPLENARLYNTPVGDVALSNKITNFLNTLNRGQEYFFRNLILDAKLHAAAKIKNIRIEKLGMDDMAKAVDEALEWTFSKTPIRGSFGDAIMRTYRAMPLLTLVNPFPRFMSNAVKFLFDYSPAGITNLLRSKTRAAIAAGDYQAISKAIIGTSMLGAATVIRANKNLAGEKWYELRWGNKTIDTRPFAPFSTYLLFAEIMVNGTEKISGKDWALAAIGINRVAGTGLALVDLISGNVDATRAKNVVNSIVSEYIGGFSVPFRTISDIIGNFKLEERTIKETRELPIIGKFISNVPGLQELLPTKYSMFQDKPLEREQGLLRQLTGITVTTKSFIQKELDRLGKEIGDLIPKTGNIKANNIISKQTGVILDKFNEKLEMSEKYNLLGDEEKLEFIKSLVSEAKKEAKGEIASDLAGVVYNELKKSKKEERKETILKLKNRGLMTENILDYLLPMIEAQPFP